MNIAEIAGLLTSVGSLIGAFILWRKSRPEINKLDTDVFNQEVTAIRETYSKMLEDQLSAVVEPMKERIDDLEKKVASLNEQIEALSRFRNLFEVSIRYIRELCHWIDSIETGATNKPKLPPELRSYFNEKEGDENDSKLSNH